MQCLVSAFNSLQENGETVPSENSDSSMKELYKKCSNRYCDFSKKYIHVDLTYRIEVEDKEAVYCEECYLAHKNQQFCFYCKLIYKDSNYTNDNKEWVECEHCKSWDHVKCESKTGFYNKFESLIMVPNFQFYCVNCRENPLIKASIKGKNKGKKRVGISIGIKKKKNSGELLGRKKEELSLT